MAEDRHNSRDNSSAVRSDESAQLRARRPWAKPMVIRASAERTEKLFFPNEITVSHGPS
jgi:hypothetical protein